MTTSSTSPTSSNSRGAGLRARHLFTDRTGGVSAPPYATLNLGLGSGDDPAAVHANRGRVAASVGVPPGRLLFLRQVHGRDVARVRADEAWPAGAAPAADAAVTSEPGLALAVLVADCVPVLLADDVHGVVGVAHAGRQGLVAGVIDAVLDAMAGAGADPATTSAVVGPSVCGRCYEVPAALRDEVGARLPETPAETSWGTPSLDLRAGVAAALRGRGVRSVDVSPRCTVEEEALFSYRREGTTGRFAGVAWLER